MNPNYNCTESFPSWYKSIEIKPEKDLVEMRINAIKSIIKSTDLKFLFDIVRIATNRKCQEADSKSTFETHFRENDINFPLSSNENLLKILAQITLCFLFESNNKLGTIVGIAVINVNFFNQSTSDSVPLYQSAKNKLTADSIDSSEELSDTNNEILSTLENLVEDEEEEKLLDHYDSMNTLKMLNHLYKENIALKEETNVLWWLFGEYSSINEKYFSEIGPLKMVISSAQELYNISNKQENIHSSKHILNKALLISNGNKPLKVVTFSETVDNIKPEARVEILKNLTPTDLTPCLLALKTSQEFDGDSLWKATFQTKNKGIDISKKIFPTDIAYQFYNEILFLNLS